ncbi:MAG: nodulation protein NfeD [Myxococcales bacterium]
MGPPGARAGSAGVFLTLAAHVASIAPSTNIGAAHPVGLFGGGPKGEPKDAGAGDDAAAVLSRKVENDTAAFVEGIAQRRSRNVEWAQKAVRESVSITATRALELKVVDLVAEDLPALLGKLDGRRVALGPGDTRTLRTAGAEIRTLSWPVRNRVLHFLANPEVAYLIGMLGVLGVLAELAHPGTVVPGVLGATCLLVAAVAFQMLPINAGALALLALGVSLVAAEIYLGGHGGFAVVGTVGVVLGSLLLVGRAPASGWFADRDSGIGLRAVIPVALALLVIAFTLVVQVGRAARNKLQAGAPGMVGQVGEVREAVGATQGGRILVNGELWSARSRDPLHPGTYARVLAVDGLTLEVESHPGPAGRIS